jgi:hypothetical protein
VQNREKHDKPLKSHGKLFAKNRKKVSHLRKIAVTPCEHMAKKPQKTTRRQSSMVKIARSDPASTQWQGKKAGKRTAMGAEQGIPGYSLYM